MGTSEVRNHKEISSGRWLPIDEIGRDNPRPIVCQKNMSEFKVIKVSLFLPSTIMIAENHVSLHHLESIPRV
jgi:hypothetical protein